MGTLGSQVMCDNIPGLVNKQRQLCRQHPKVMQAIGAGMKDWIAECQHQFQNHRWNCNTMARDHNVFGRLLLRSEYDNFDQTLHAMYAYKTHYIYMYNVDEFV